MTWNTHDRFGLFDKPDTAPSKVWVVVIYRQLTGESDVVGVYYSKASAQRAYEKVLGEYANELQQAQEASDDCWSQSDEHLWISGGYVWLENDVYITYFQRNIE